MQTKAAMSNIETNEARSEPAKPVRADGGVREDAMKSRTSVRDIEPILLSATDAACLLGITRAALYQRVHSHQVGGVVRIGRRLQFHRERLLAWLDRKVSK